ncbi:kinase-like domain, phloem protein 2-like protein [Tanacetum coccineum]
MASFVAENKHLEIQLEEIKSATDNFNENKVIGTSESGKVYVGELSHSKGKSLVFIKRIDRTYWQGDLEFYKEVRMISCYKHENILSLLGFCTQGGEMVLVYEHASNGSLDKRLNDATLTWAQRIKICLDAAKGLSFLHDPQGTHQRLLHYDIKSSNILLNEKLNAKVYNFGSKLHFGPCDIAFQCLQTSHEERPTMSLVVEKLEIALEIQEPSEGK